MFSIGISELVLIVADINKSKKFYQDIVGLVSEPEQDNEWVWFWAGLPGQSQRIALHKGTLLFEEFSPHSAGRRWGNIHFALEVPRDKFEQAQSHIFSKNVTIYGPVRQEWMNADSIYFYDLDGNLLEFWSPDPMEKSAV